MALGLVRRVAASHGRQHSINRRRQNPNQRQEQESAFPSLENPIASSPFAQATRTEMQQKFWRRYLDPHRVARRCCFIWHCSQFFGSEIAATSVARLPLQKRNLY